MEKVQWKVEGMDCNTCAISIHKYLEKQGMKNVKVNYATGDVMFDAENKIPEDKISRGISDLGYTVVDASRPPMKAAGAKKLFTSHLQRFWVCFPFTAVLMLHMIPAIPLHWLMNDKVQLALTIPVYLIGMSYFGPSAYKSLKHRMPNMNVLIAIGATAAFVYSLYGTIIGNPDDFLFYETAATIITLVFLGNYMEETSIASTQRALNKIAKSQKVIANMIAFDDEHKEQIFQVENTQLRVGDLILIKSGEQVPIDAKILWGEAEVNEAIVTGESLPVYKTKKDNIIGGSILVDGTVKAQVTATGNDTVLSAIINMVKNAQGEKPPVQLLADKISAIFIPVVLAIAGVTFLVSWMVLTDFTAALMRSIAVLVIACPCAMGLATPAAIAVGLGRAARNGILFRNATSLENFKTIRQVVFDKTGTLTTGNFRLAGFWYDQTKLEEAEFKKIAYSLEKYSAHPLAQAVVREWKLNDLIYWQKTEEIKGLGIQGTDRSGIVFLAGSFKTVKELGVEEGHNIYITRNNELLGWIDLQDELRPEAKELIGYLHKKGLKTILLSGDSHSKCELIGKELGIDTVIAEQSPEQKLKKIDELNMLQPTAMIGDGINDAPALAKATIGISMNDSSQVALQSAHVVLMNQGLKKLPLALGLGEHTYITIKQNLFWALFYNVIAIPVAAFGFLSPTVGALVMGFSDVVLAINSVRLFVKKVS